MQTAYGAFGFVSAEGSSVAGLHSFETVDGEPRDEFEVWLLIEEL